MVRFPPVPLLAATLLAAAAAPVRAQSLALEASPFPGLRTGARAIDIAEGNDGRLWFAFADAVQVLDGSRAVDIGMQPDSNGRVPSGARRLTASRSGRAFLATTLGVWEVEPGQKVATCALELSDGGAWDLAVDVSNALYVRTARGALVRRDANGSWSDLVSPAGDTSFAGVVAASDAVWCWSDRVVWRLCRDGDALHWDQRGTLRGGDRLVVGVDREALLAVQGDELLRFEPTGHAISITSAPEFVDVRHVATGPEGWWLASIDDLWYVPREQASPIPVQLYQRGSQIALDLSCVTVDDCGLLWVGSSLDPLRVRKPIGIDHLVFDVLDLGESVTAVAEDANGVLLAGTTAHRLLECRNGRWSRRETPWPTSEGITRRGIECMHASADHGLVVGSATFGVWAEREGTWSRVELDLQQALLHTMQGDPVGGLWVLGDHKVLHRRHRDAAFERISLPRGESGIGPSPAALLWHGDSEILATFRDGLMRRCAGETEFRAFGEPWPVNGLMNLLPADDATGFHAVSSRGLWRIDGTTGARTLLHETSPSAPFRASARGTDGRLWLASTTHLASYHAKSQRMHVLTPREGAHPLGYSWRAAATRRNGETWFGAKRGLTRIRPEAGLGIGAEPRVLGAEVEIAGREPFRVELGAELQLPVGSASLQVRPRVLDRLCDAPAPCRVLVRDANGRDVGQSETGVLSGLVPGRYTLLAEVRAASVGRAVVELGRVAVPEPPFRWDWPLLTLVFASVGLGFMAFRSRRSAQRALPRRIAVDRLLALADRPVEQTLDLAFLAVAAGAECARRSRAAHTSVFLTAEVGDERVRLTELGYALDDAEERAKAVLGRGERLGEATWILRDGDRADVVMGTRGVGSLAFQFFLHRVPMPLGDLLAECAEALAPVQSGLRKQAWLERLESDFAHQSARLNAGLHDLRGSLTALRTSAFALGEGTANGGVEADARQLADSAEHVLSRVEHLLEGLESSAGVQLRIADPTEIVRRSVALLQPRAAAKGIALVVDLPESVGGVQLDPSWFGRAVDNIVGNAVKFSPAGTTVHVHCELPAQDFALHVDDEGPGFLDHEREAVFLPGVTGSAQPTGGERQSGLGLWVARQAVRAMGGRLWVEPTTGKGARVSLAIPRATSSGTAN